MHPDAEGKMIGRMFGSFRVLEKLGEGGTGTVWRAQDVRLGRYVALKILGPQYLESETARVRFRATARLAARLEHPRIATLLDVGESDGLDWIAHQYIDGTTLARKIAQGPLDLKLARAIALDILDALSYAHGQSVLHRDVTAGNVMITGSGRAVIVDFGLARLLGEARVTGSGHVLGTVGYMAPEVLDGADGDGRADLYGVGSVLYQVITGRLPFEGTPPEIVQQSLNQAPEPASEYRPELSGEFESFVLRLLERDPANRFGSADEAREVAEDLVADAAPSRLELLARRVRRRFRSWQHGLGKIARAPVAAGALGVIVVLGAGIWLAAREGLVPGMPQKPLVVAVLPMANETDDPESNEHIANGLAEALATNLAQSERMSVLPWITTQRIRVAGKSPKELGRELHAKLLVFGSLRNSQDALEVRLSMIDAIKGTQLWSRNFAGEENQLPSLEARMTFEAATAALGKLTEVERARMQIPSGQDGRAYNFYLLGASNLQAGDPVSLATAEQFYRRSIEIDSTFADAYVGLGAVYNARYFAGIEGGRENFERAIECFRTAERLDPNSALVMRALANVYWQQGRTEECLKLGQKAARLRPATADRRLVVEEAYVLGSLPDLGLQVGEDILASDPLNPAARFWAVIGAAFAGRPEVVLSHGTEYIRRFGEESEVYLWLSAAEMSLGHVDRSLIYARRSVDLSGEPGDPRFLIALALAQKQSGDLDSYHSTLDLVIQIESERIEMVNDQPRNRLALMEALTMRGSQEDALRVYRLLRPALVRDGFPPIADCDFVPKLLVLLGQREEAQLMLEEFDRRKLISHPPGSLAAIELEVPRPELNRDPIVQDLMERARRRAAELRSRYGRF